MLGAEGREGDSEHFEPRVRHRLARDDVADQRRDTGSSVRLGQHAHAPQRTVHARAGAVRSEKRKREADGHAHRVADQQLLPFFATFAKRKLVDEKYARQRDGGSTGGLKPSKWLGPRMARTGRQTRPVLVPKQKYVTVPSTGPSCDRDHCRKSEREQRGSPSFVESPNQNPAQTLRAQGSQLQISIEWQSKSMQHRECRS
eukprot:4677896-Pleurochrysis_carterae.AAC.1